MHKRPLLAQSCPWRESCGHHSSLDGRFAIPVCIAGVCLIDQSPRITNDSQWQLGLFGSLTDGQLKDTLGRLRGDFVKPTTLRTASPFGYPQLRALGATKQAELAVATLAGKPIAYASIAGAKTARLFTSTDCQED